MGDDRLPPPDQIAPLKAARCDGSNWIVAYQTGFSEEGQGDWGIVTDSARGSSLCGYELPGDAKHDAESVAAILNAYRTGRLVLAPMPLLPDTQAARGAELETASALLGGFMKLSLRSQDHIALRSRTREWLDR